MGPKLDDYGGVAYGGRKRVDLINSECGPVELWRPPLD
jgi:hypothetical protein